MADDGQQQTEKSGAGSDREKSGDSSDGALESRLKSLESELHSRRRVEAEPVDNVKDSAGFANAIRLSSEFVVAILVGFGIGWLIDRFLGTTPWAMIVMLLLGFCAGVLNVMRSAGLVAENRALSGRPDTGSNETDKDEHSL